MVAMALLKMAAVVVVGVLTVAILAYEFCRK